MPLQLLFVVAIFFVVGALWLRRASLNCRWEGGHTLLLISSGFWVYFSSPHAHEYLGKPLYRITGLSHADTLLGNYAALTAASAAVYMFVLRFGGHVVQSIYMAWVIRPLTALVPVLFMCHVFAVSAGPDSERLTSQYLQTANYPGFWMMAYWSLMLAAMIYLMSCALRALLAVRRREWRSGSPWVINLYLTALWATIGTLSFLAIDIYTPFNLSVLAMSLGYVCVALWCVAVAYSWRVKSRRLRIPEPSEWQNPQQLTDDDGSLNY